MQATIFNQTWTNEIQKVIHSFKKNNDEKKQNQSRVYLENQMLWHWENQLNQNQSNIMITLDNHLKLLYC